LFNQRLGVIALVATVEYSQRTTKDQVGKVSATGIMQALYFVPAQGIEDAGGIESCCYGLSGQIFIH
jgi:hypothetical protein